jgi:hypothetical protein
MAKGHLVLPDGTNVVVEGSAEELAKIMTLYAGATGGSTKKTSGKARNRSAAATGNKPVSRTGAQSRIVELIGENYFAQKRNLNAVVEELKANGYIYTQQLISTPLRRLVQGKKLRRIKEDGKWVFINP